MERLRRWLHKNGHDVIREWDGPEGVDLTVRAPGGREALLHCPPGRDPMLLALALQDILDGNYEVA
jgi:hypothetical protein